MLALGSIYHTCTYSSQVAKASTEYFQFTISLVFQFCDQGANKTSVTVLIL